MLSNPFVMAPSPTSATSTPSAPSAPSTARSGVAPSINSNTSMEVPATAPLSSAHPRASTASTAPTTSAADRAGAALSPSSILSDPNPSPTTPTPNAAPNVTATIEPASDLTTPIQSHDGEQARSRPEHAAYGITSSDSAVPDCNNNKSPGLPNSALSIDSVPRQTIIKALASAARGRNNKPEALSLNNMLSTHSAAGKRPSTSAPSSQKIADALNELALQTSTPNTAFPSLQSPCFYHNRFDDAVDIDKVLEEIKNDEWMSHSRLVQTATGVREVSKQLQRRPIRRAVKNVMIVTKARDNELVYLTRELAVWLLRTPRYGSDVGVNVYVDAKLRHSKRFGAASIIDEDPRFPSMLHYWSPDLCWSQPEKFDLVCTLGGDGTVLFTSWLFQRIVPPVISFSLGSLGFLTTFEFEKYKQHLNRIMGDEGMRVNLRMRFTCTVYRHGESGGEMEEGEQFEVLNELVIDRGPSPYVSNLELYGDNELLTVVQADGCIFSTPTGSTAYSLSAGGALVHPDIPAILLTPICPHTLSFRPMVLSDTMLLRVSVPRNSRATAYCAFDGKGRVELRQGDHVTITASQYPFPTVMRTNTEWFDSVSRTLQWNTRAATQKGFDSNSGSQAASVKDDEPEWDIDTDSACYASEDGSIAASPLRRQMSLLGM
ncbi:ATP-NAD kinase [Xylaria cf. heliscus]|nr:ATP-NAD kinase [Xylaria cf. heliscus]